MKGEKIFKNLYKFIGKIIKGGGREENLVETPKMKDDHGWKKVR
jgi:hypothetical protein